LFYAEGIDTYNVESQTYNNLYDSKSYYYITTSGGDGKGLRRKPTQWKQRHKRNYFDDHQFHELDLINIANSADNGLVNLLISSKIKNLNLIFQT
jgi:hypothetical protein